MNKIAEIKDRLAATTPGIWSFSVPQQTLMFSPPAKSVQVQTENGKFAYVEADGCQLSRADIEFMAHAREDINYLLELIEKVAEAIK